MSHPYFLIRCLFNTNNLKDILPRKVWWPKMSQQAMVGQGMPAAAGQAGRGRHHCYQGQGDPPIKRFWFVISKIASNTFNTGQNCFAERFTQSRKKMANYLLQMASDEGYLVAKMVRMGKVQTIDWPPAVDKNAPKSEDLKIIWEEVIRAIAKRKAKLNNVLKKGLVTVYDQCLQEVRDKLEASKDWDKTQWNQ
jgi:hypothetical protein